jgi:Tol biopolymer transport system component/DNA-binding winged helix-turn-helix (wHTH) protein
MSNPNSLQNNKLFGFGVFKLNTNDGLFVNGKQVKLAPKVFRTLILFVENKGRVVSKDELFEKIWEDAFVEESAISFNISKLRQALAKYDNQTVFIETLPKRGFRFNADVIELDFESAETEIVYEKYQKQELIIEEINQEASAKPVSSFNPNNWLRIYFPLSAALLLLILGGFAFWQWQKNNELRSFDSLQTVKLTSWKSTGSNFQTKYSVSNNGNLFAYSSIKNSNEEIFIKQIDGGEDVQITNGEWNSFSPIWSPDDKQIAFVSVRENQVGIYTCPSLGGGFVLQKIVGKDKVILIKWSNDGTKIYYDVKGNLFALSIDTKEVSQTTNFSDIRDGRNFSFSKDEKYIAYCQKNDGQTDIWVKELSDDTPFQITNDKSIESELVWHPDSKRILYGVNRNGHSQINLGFVNKEQPLQFTRTEDEYKLLDLSSDGKKVFYISLEDKSDIWSIETEYSNETKVAKENDSEFWADDSPDGKLLSYQINSMPDAISKLTDSFIVIKNTNPNTKKILVKGFNQKWLPDSKRISFMRWENENKRNNIWTFDVVSGEEKQITTYGVGLSGFALMPYNRNQISDFSWSTDNNKIVYSVSKPRNILLTSIDSDETLNITNNDNPNLSFYCPLWSKDNKKVVFISTENSNEKIIYNVLLYENGSLETIFSTNESLRLLGWSEFDNEIICISTFDILKSYPMDTKLISITTSGNSEIINSFEQISVLSSVLSPDGKNIAFTKRQENKDNIYVATIKDKSVKKITENSDTETLFGSLLWSFDGKKLFFDKQEKINVISVIENFE